MTGAAKGRLRTDPKALRFVEVVLNGPKTWSLAAALHPEIADALDAAQTRAAEQIIGWVAEHANTRVGSKGRQVQVPVSEIEAAVVRLVAQDSARRGPVGDQASRPASLLRQQPDRRGLRRRHRAAGAGALETDDDTQHLRTPVADRGGPHPQGRSEPHERRSSRDCCGLSADSGHLDPV